MYIQVRFTWLFSWALFTVILVVLRDSIFRDDNCAVWELIGLIWGIITAINGVYHLRQNLWLHDEFRKVPTTGTIWDKRPPVGLKEVADASDNSVNQTPTL